MFWMITKFLFKLAIGYGIFCVICLFVFLGLLHVSS
ncbi:hypothetical protein Kuja_1645 [Vibrio phage vB_VchM_Kuja]|uniref:Uncharacterized protein n=1 Tax=Vibrio phage vB_VchM_Kuja TaxID=2686437 RepID=A0A6B9JAZ9_9CAUD|nr:hypothetical protein HWC83_gp071 [Vibrio phage vB_VchM_Kuja]QGZ16156.1 hypothetical protein Kuja_1645 [Vibrio phage vB_VchM_Kuja]